MKKTVALFSGQGSQYPGMGKALYEAYPEARQVYECACDLLGFDVRKVSFEGTPEELSSTLVAQPAIFTLSMAAYEAYRSRLPAPDAVAGHSLGEFAALCAGEAYSLEDGFRLIKARAQAMDAAGSAAAGAMYAVIGSTAETIEDVCRETTGFVRAVNYNLPKQTVISGEEKAAAAAAASLEAAGARVVRLAVSAAFHTELMAPAAERLKDEISGLSFSAPKMVFYSNVTGGTHEIIDFPAYFATHMVSPVRFVDQVAAMVGDGVEQCVEFGPGKTTSTLAKKNERALKVWNVENPETLEALGEKLEL